MPAPEILAPAGNAEMLRAAGFAGADAVYLGLDGYNARRSAGNFTPQALREAVCFCHARGVAVHVTLNTLVYGDELEGLAGAVRAIAGAGADAVILDDLAAAALVILLHRWRHNTLLSVLGGTAAYMMLLHIFA